MTLLRERLRGAVVVATMPLAGTPAWGEGPRPGSPDTLADLVERLSPAVVNVSTTQIVAGTCGSIFTI